MCINFGFSWYIACCKGVWCVIPVTCLNGVASLRSVCALQQDDVRVLISAAMQPLNAHNPAASCASVVPASSATVAVPSTQLQTSIGREMGISLYNTALLGSPGPAAAITQTTTAAAASSGAASLQLTPSGAVPASSVAPHVSSLTSSVGVGLASGTTTTMSVTSPATAAVAGARSEPSRREELEGQECGDGKESSQYI